MTDKAQADNKSPNVPERAVEVQFVTGEGSGQSDVCAEKVPEPSKK